MWRVLQAPADIQVAEVLALACAKRAWPYVAAHAANLAAHAWVGAAAETGPRRRRPVRQRRVELQRRKRRRPLLHREEEEVKKSSQTIETRKYRRRWANNMWKQEALAAQAAQAHPAQTRSGGQEEQ